MASRNDVREGRIAPRGTTSPGIRRRRYVFTYLRGSTARRSSHRQQSAFFEAVAVTDKRLAEAMFRRQLGDSVGCRAARILAARVMQGRQIVTLGPLTRPPGSVVWPQKEHRFDVAGRRFHQRAGRVGLTVMWHCSSRLTAARSTCSSLRTRRARLPGSSHWRSPRRCARPRPGRRSPRSTWAGRRGGVSRRVGRTGGVMRPGCVHGGRRAVRGWLRRRLR
jgi:hypothetical protein